MAKYLDLPGLEHFRDKMRSWLGFSASNILPVSHGGTGATDAAKARSNLGLGALSTLGSPLPVSHGGTGATDAATAQGNLGLNGQLGFMKAGRGNISDMSRDTLYNLAPGTYLVNNNATNSPVPGQYGNLIVSYASGNRVVAVCAFDGGSVWSVVGASSTANFTWSPLHDRRTLWSGSWCGNSSISVPGMSRYNVLVAAMSFAQTEFPTMYALAARGLDNRFDFFLPFFTNDPHIYTGWVGFVANGDTAVASAAFDYLYVNTNDWGKGIYPMTLSRIMGVY